MKKIRKFIGKNGESIIIVLSILSLLMGFLYSVAIIYKNIFNNNKLDENQIKLIIVLILGGLLGSVLDFVLKKQVRDFITKYLDDKKIESIVNEIIEVNMMLEKEQNEKANNDESSKDENLDTVIVPVANSFIDVSKNKIYQCPHSRKFKEGLKYISFYKDKKVVGVGEIENNYLNIDNNLLLFKFKDFKELNIPHDQKGAFVQNKMYCNYERLILAKSTNEIR